MSTENQIILHRSSYTKDENVEIADLNILISTLKRREENSIQLLDYTIKYNTTKAIDDKTQLEELVVEIDMLEKNRQILENQIFQKYLEWKISDAKQKK